MSLIRPPDIRLICFDLGGVVVRTCASPQEGCARAGVPYRPEIETPEVRARLEQAGAAYELGRCSTAEYFARAEAALDGRQPAAEVALVHDAWILGEYRGMDRLAGAIRAAGVETACLSNTNERHWELMSAQPLAYPAFAAMDTATPATCSAWPSLIPRSIVPSKSSVAYPPGESFFFDDRTENVAAARNAGWHAELIDPREDTTARPRRTAAPGLGL